MEGGASLRPFEGARDKLPFIGCLHLIDFCGLPSPSSFTPHPHRSLRHKSPMLQEGVWKETSQKHLAKMSSRRLSASGLLWALALRPVFLSLAHAQQEHSSEVWFTGRQRLLLWASLNAWPT